MSYQGNTQPEGGVFFSRADFRTVCTTNRIGTSLKKNYNTFFRDVVPIRLVHTVLKFVRVFFYLSENQYRCLVFSPWTLIKHGSHQFAFRIKIFTFLLGKWFLRGIMISTKTITCVTLCLMVVSECWFPADSYAVYHFKRYSYKKKQKNVST